MTSSSEASPDKTQWRVIAAASIGNSLEWFDFVVFGFLAATMAKLFFPPGDETIALLLTFATFGVTFLVRPLGAVVLGAYGDRRGRKAALILTIILMALGTLLIAFTPTYASIGIWAPLVVLVARVLQGLSVGGEFGTATAFLAEQDPQRRGFLASWQFASQGLTTALATGFGAALTTMLTPAQLEAWGWRIPFVFGLVIAPVAYYIRTRLSETPEFVLTSPADAPLRELVAGQKHRLLLCLGVIVVSTVLMYTILFMPTFAIRQLGLPPSGAFLAGLLTGAIQVGVIPVIGALSDRYGRTAFGLVAAVAILLLIYPMFAWMVAVPTLQTLLLVQALMGVLSAVYLGGLAGLFAELFPTRTRTTGLSIGYALAVAIFGGFAPFISAWLIATTGNRIAPSFYVMVASIISIGSLIVARRLGFR
jgi:MHS family proline/betaine transporter-like MFS transporter